MSVILKKLETAEWHDGYPGMDELDIPNVEALKKAKTALLVNGEHFGVGLERYEPVSFDWHYEHDEVFYLISGGPFRVTCEGKTVAQNPGDIIYISKGSDVHFEIVDTIFGITFVYPSLGEIIDRLRKKYKKK